jgi:MOSC domain-containing protein YiiM
LFVDLDLSVENLPSGQRIAIGTAVLEITGIPHTGCKKFSERYGNDAAKFVNSPEGRRHRYRGLNARVIQSGAMRAGDHVVKIATE